MFYTHGMNEPSIFTKIINGEIPSHKVYEDEYSYAFMDIHPIQTGQVLVVPKKQVDFIWNLEPAEYQGLMAAVQKVGQRLQEMYPEAARIGLMVQGLDVDDHAHVKVFPFSTAAEYYHQPDMNDEPDHAALAELAEKLKF
jgi:histidine triad (HIT) family protein